MNSGRLAIIGARGVSNHGGFETVVAELAPRLKTIGYDVYCSVRAPEGDAHQSSFRGVRLISFPFKFPRAYSVGKIFEVLYDSYFVLKCRLAMKCDVTYCLGVASGFSLLITRWLGSSSVVNVDGIEWTRAKFGTLARFFLHASFIACCIGSDRIILDNRALLEFVPRRFRDKAVCITYGVSPISCEEDSGTRLALPADKEIMLEPSRYWLVVARLEPENNIHEIIKGYLASRSVMPLVVVGDCSSPRYRSVLSDLAESARGAKKVLMPGSIYNQSFLKALRCRCFAYIHGHSVGGTNPSLLEAMSAGNIILSHDNIFNREVCSEAALFFSDSVGLAVIMDDVESDPSSFTSLGMSARDRADKYHQWDAVVTLHDRLFRELTSA